jgi:hypothetical protein
MKLNNSKDYSTHRFLPVWSRLCKPRSTKIKLKKILLNQLKLQFYYDCK